jgi:hypothetical protein
VVLGEELVGDLVGPGGDVLLRVDGPRRRGNTIRMPPLSGILRGDPRLDNALNTTKSDTAIATTTLTLNIDPNLCIEQDAIAPRTIAIAAHTTSTPTNCSGSLFPNSC